MSEISAMRIEGFQVQQMVVRDEQDVRSLAVEIATLTRRQQRGQGLRLL